MKYYHLNARLLAPLMVQENRQSNAPCGLPYLPGGSLRGAVAGLYLRNGGSPEDPAFRTIFLDDPVFFPDLLPSHSPDQASRPLPITAASCKRSPGFILDKAHGVCDSLAAFMAAELEGGPVTGALTCTACAQDIKPFSGFWNGNLTEAQKNDPVLVYHRHTGIDRHTGTVASSIFYITQGIAESWKSSDDRYHPQYLSGGLFLNKDQFEILSDWLTETVFAGADRTRGMGELAISLDKTQAPAFDLKAWSSSFKNKLSRLTSKQMPQGEYFSVGFASHAIMVDAFLRPSQEIMPDFPDLVMDTRMIRQHTVRGWQASWQLPKPEDVAIGMGGVCLFRYTGNDIQGLNTYLTQLMIQGIGLRRSEGFGRIHVCDPFHIQEVI
jgi:CRISPR-associated Csx10 family RAMP protein